MILVGAVVAGLVTALSNPFVVRALERRAVFDQPGARSSHSAPTLRGGGIAPALGALAGAATAVAATDRLLVVIAGTALAMGLLGLRDDLGSLPVRQRLLVQAVIAAAVGAPLVDGLASGLGAVVLVVGAAAWIVACVNAFNFMDGINGISAAQATVAGGAWALVGWWQDLPLVTATGAVVMAAAVAFAPFNFPTARVFLGDAGSYFLGGWLAAAAVAGLSHGLTLEMAVAPLTIYLADTGLTLMRRAARGESITTPHCEHVYQRLVQSGWSQTRTTLTIAGLMALCSAGGAMSMTGGAATRAAGGLLLVVTAGGYVLAPERLRSPAVTACGLRKLDS